MFLLFPNQLFYDSQSIHILKKNASVYLIEDPLYFYDTIHRPFRYHKSKLAYLVACMNIYKDFLISKNINVTYISYDDTTSFYQNLKLSQQTITIFDPTDYVLTQKLQKYISTLTILPSPNFLLSPNQLSEYHKKHLNSSRHSSFYTFVKSTLNILKGIPNQDKLNRESFPRSFHPPPENPKRYKHKYYDFAISYITSHPQFKDNIGDLDNLNIWPISYKDTISHFRLFLETKFKEFGRYQDAVYDDQVFLNHSAISPMINIGILQPSFIVNETLEYANQHPEIPINSLEGFLRQIIGWREYMRYLYVFQYPNLNIQQYKNTKYTRLTNKHEWLTGTTSIEPINREIQKCIKYGYSHHIIRLMFFLNVFILTKIHPEDIYQWFMEVIAMDAYEWVMRSNIYCMGYFYTKAMARQYTSSSNYILKMSNYKRGSWCKVWDELYHKYHTI